ncbi:unnamed protein product [Dibothriocephalus latus]|uniref:G-protein coupled receptors family 1 profile domain-containing protein n=1 Tax=Dibothriocephalus latus TaxID=60516 RepID=A0A3P7LCS6_DIBLA|nr:unnamed protein product [Dibothriocephalus latus]
MRTPTNLLLLGIAISDLLTCLLPLPVYLLYFTDVFDKNLTVLKAYASYTLSVSLPTVFHTVAIWLTLLLAIQRFIYITMPLSIQRRQICKFSGVWAAFGLTILLAVIHHSSAFLTTFEEGITICYEPADSENGSLSNSREPYGRQKHMVVTYQEVLLKCTPFPESTFFILLFLRVLTIHLGPSVFLCVLTAYMSYTLHQIGKKRKQLLMKNNAFKTSKIMLVVLGIFLSVEVPTTIFIVTYAVIIVCRVPPPPGMAELREICNLLIVFSYPSNFIVYCAMSRQFRATIAAIIPGCLKERIKRVKNLTSPSTQDVVETFQLPNTVN